jgi:hypothetical protein
MLWEQVVGCGGPLRFLCCEFMACRRLQVEAEVSARNLFTTTRQMFDIGRHPLKKSAYRENLRACDGLGVT